MKLDINQVQVELPEHNKHVTSLIEALNPQILVTQLALQASVEFSNCICTPMALYDRMEW
jgi:hypothetical protein